MIMSHHEHSRRRFAQKAAQRREYNRTHTEARIAQRYAQTTIPRGLLEETRNSIRKNRSVLIGHQNRCSVHAVNSSRGLVILMYDARRKTIVTALPLKNPYTTTLINTLNRRKHLHEHEQRILEQAHEAHARNPAPREWATFTSILEDTR